MILESSAFLVMTDINRVIVLWHRTGAISVIVMKMETQLVHEWHAHLHHKYIHIQMIQIMDVTPVKIADKGQYVL
jgi:hypothetical protein